MPQNSAFFKRHVTKVPGRAIYNRVVEGRAASIPRFRPAVRACRYAPPRFLSSKYNLWHSYTLKTRAPQDKTPFLHLQDRGTPRKDCVPFPTSSRPGRRKTRLRFLHHQLQDRGTPRQDCVLVPTSSRPGRSKRRIKCPLL